MNHGRLYILAGDDPRTFSLMNQLGYEIEPNLEFMQEVVTRWNTIEAVKQAREAIPQDPETDVFYETKAE